MLSRLVRVPIWFASLSIFACFAVRAIANPPVPANDTPGTAQVIGPAVPAIAYGTNNAASNAIGTSGALTVAGPDVFYSFTPSASDNYRIQLIPWQRACLRSSDRQFTIYIQDTGGSHLGGLRAAGSARPVHFDVALTGATTYIIGVDYLTAGNLTTNQAEFTLIVDTKPATAPDNCGTSEALSTTLPTAALNDIDGAANDFDADAAGQNNSFSLTNNPSSCGVANTTLSAGNDHVYTFTPTVTGRYAFELVPSTPTGATSFNHVLYVSDACPPGSGNCLGASNNQTTNGTGSGAHDMVVCSLNAGTTYYAYVDNGATAAANQVGAYALLVDTAAAYEITEQEPNDDSTSATVIGAPPVGGQVIGPTNPDWWKISGVPGDRLYAYANGGGASNSSIDTNIDFIGTDGSSVIEFDDDDSSGVPAPAANGAMNFLTSTSSGLIAGATFSGTGDHFIRVNADSATGTLSRYRLHVGVEPAGRVPAAEAEPNDSLATANLSPKQYYAGTITSATDIDFFKFNATAGDQVFIALDGDPERNSSGGSTAYASDPMAFVGNLTIIDPAGDNFYSAFSGDTTATNLPDYPGMGCSFVAHTTGTYAVRVAPASTTSHVGPDKTYNVAIFLNGQAPVISDGLNPVVMLTPDFNADTIAVTATDNQAMDTGICMVTLDPNTNLQLNGLTFTPGDPSVSFSIGLVSGGTNGGGVLKVEDCAGNIASVPVKIDVQAPVCDGTTYSKRTPVSLGPPVHVPDNNPTGIMSTINVADAGTISDVNVTLTIEQWALQDLDIFLQSPGGSMVELVTDQGSSLTYDFFNVTFDDSAAATMGFTNNGPPLTGTFKPDDPAGLAQLNGQSAQGNWVLHVIDDSSTANGGAHLVRWSLDISGSFASPQRFDGVVTDSAANDSGIQSVVMSADTNVALNLPSFTPGAASVSYVLTLVNPNQNGSATITVTDMQNNTCQSVIALAGAPDSTAPGNTGSTTTEIRARREAQLNAPPNSQAGVTSTISISENVLVGEVEVHPIIDTENLGRITSTLTHGGTFASLVNRVGMTERGSVGLTKDNAGAYFDDDAPQTDDAHLEPASGAIEFVGLHQPDGRGDFLFDGISSDRRGHMLFGLSNVSSAGDWTLLAADFRGQGFSTSGIITIFRRWELIIKSPCGPQRYYGTATDLQPGTGITSIVLAGGATNLTLEVAPFSPGAEQVEYVARLTNPALAGTGIVNIIDGANNVTAVPVSLTPASADQSPPVVSGAVNQAIFKYEGTATDVQAGDTGVAAVELLPYSTNLQIESVTPTPPAGSVSFVIGLVNPAENGRGYVRVTDGCGWRSHTLVAIDATAPTCGGTVGNTKRYVSTDPPQPLPDNDLVGVLSSITVSDTDIISDVDITFFITHGFDDDIDMTLQSPMAISLFNDIGSTGNDFFNTTLDDEAPGPMPDNAASAPFDGRFQPSPGPLSLLDGSFAAGTYTLKVVDDKANDFGSFDRWWITIESATFPERFAGEARDGELNGTGIQSIQLLPGACNVVLQVDAFAPGSRLVHYEVRLLDPQGCGRGTVRVTDVAGNTCDQVVTLDGVFCLPGDVDHNGVVNFNDVDDFVTAVLAGAGNCETDVNLDGKVDGLDVQAFTDVLVP